VSRRHLVALCFAFVICFGLFWIMQSLINVEGELDESEAGQVVDFVRLKRDSQVETRKRDLPDHKPPERELVTLVGDPLFQGCEVDGIYRVDGPDSFSLIADIGDYSSKHLPDPSIPIFLVNGVQYAIDAFRGGFLVTDGHHNRVLQVSLDGQISEFKVFGNIVPTGLEVRGDQVYIAEAGPVPHNPEDGRIVEISAQNGAESEVDHLGGNGEADSA
jgi:hypothetical protein